MKQNKLYIFCGIPFSGKTTLAKEVEKTLGYRRIDIDDIKFDLFGKDIKDSKINKEDWDKIYKKMYKQIEEFLKKGETIIHDAGNFTKHERDLIRKIANKLDIETIAVFIDTPKEVAWVRLLQNRKTDQRFDVSNDDFESTVAEMDVPDESEKHIVYKPGTQVAVWIRENFN